MNYYSCHYQSGDVTCCVAFKLGCCAHKDSHSERQTGNNASNFTDALPAMRGGSLHRHNQDTSIGFNFKKVFVLFAILTI